MSTWKKTALPALAGLMCVNAAWAATSQQFPAPKTNHGVSAFLVKPSEGNLYKSIFKKSSSGEGFFLDRDMV